MQYVLFLPWFNHRHVQENEMIELKSSVKAYIMKAHIAYSLYHIISI